MSLVEMLAAAQMEYQQDEIQLDVLKILDPGNEFLQELVDQFGKTRRLNHKAQIACFYELKSSNVGRIVGGTDRMRFVVSESSGCLDLSDATSKYPLSRTHFNMNKFGKPMEEDYLIVKDVIEDMIESSPGLILARSEHRGKHKIDFTLQGVPEVSKFVARNTEMQQLERFLINTPISSIRRSVIVMHGLGGIGKTQIAVEFARKYKHTFSGIFWLDGSSEASLKQSFVTMARRLPQDELPSEAVATLSQATIEVDVVVRGCLKWLSLLSNQQWLLIFDNVDRDHHDQDDFQAYNIKDYFPGPDHGSMIITTRLASLSRLGEGVKIGTVATDQARDILESNAGKPVPDAELILELLEGLPLALTQAGSYMRMTNISASAYAKYYSNTWNNLMEKQNRFPQKDYDRSVLTTWTMSYEQVQKQNEGAACLLKLWGFLDKGEIWYELIATLPEVDLDAIPSCLLQIAREELEFIDAAGVLLRYSLIESKEGTYSYSMHSVLHTWCGYLAEHEERYKLRLLAVHLVAFFDLRENDMDYWKRQRRLVPHIICVSDCILKAGDSRSKEEETAQELVQPLAIVNLGCFVDDIDKWLAEKLYLYALERCDKTGDPEDINALAAANNLGNLYRLVGRNKEAEQLLQRAFVGNEKKYGQEHHRTLCAGHNLGVLYRELGKYMEAEQLLKRTIVGYEEVYGQEYYRTLSAVYSLGILYRESGKYMEAEQLLERALVGYEKVYGKEHRRTLPSVQSLGILYSELGKYKEAEQLLKRALVGFEKVFEAESGAEYDKMFDVASNLGLVYAKMKRFEESERFSQHALDGFGKNIDLNITTYTPALYTMWNLGYLRDCQNRVDEARNWYSQALLGLEKVYGDDHTVCQTLRRSLAGLENDGVEREILNEATPEEILSRTQIMDDFDSPPNKPAFK
ncbi:hypothetical protein GQ44DRAFT_684501 [Phaeosphaeriaceae sp. PMI808]|nr:hypothetical protein GQ44DRAFT_684501 [Phaeosphaeriaceae sp. PMI808]